jgi:hypothetical protein
MHCPFHRSAKRSKADLGTRSETEGCALAGRKEWSLTPRLSGFEMLNATTFPISGVSFCLLPDKALVDRFRDGRAKLVVAMERQGSMRVDELDVTVRGAPK